MINPPRLRTLLLVSNLAVLLLPVTGLWALRLYESALVRQTEAELVAQAAVLAAVFREELRRGDPEAGPSPTVTPGVGAAALGLNRRPGLDLADDPVLPPPPAPAAAEHPADARALAVGRALAAVLRDAQAVTLAALRVTDAHGVVVASTGGDLGQSLAGWDEVAQVLAGAPVVSSMHRREQAQPVPGGITRTAGLRVFVAMPVQGAEGVAGAVVLSRTPRDLGQAAYGKRVELAGLTALLLTVGMLLAAGLSRLVTRPLAVVVAQARRAAQGAAIVPLQRPGTREVAELSAAITRMAATLDQRAQYITAFAASVSHEFKTPLAALQGAAELLQDHEGLPAVERARLLDVLAGNAGRLDRLVRRMLELARADMTPAGTTAVGPVLRRLAERYRFAWDGGDASVALPAEALEALLASLLDNAVAHAGPNVGVRVRVSGVDGRTEILVEDDGPGISAANVDRVFEPFFTTARASGGTGLGLAIVRAIATAAGGGVTLTPCATGARFLVVLPANRG